MRNINDMKGFEEHKSTAASTESPVMTEEIIISELDRTVTDNIIQQISITMMIWGE